MGQPSDSHLQLADISADCDLQGYEVRGIVAPQRNVLRDFYVAFHGLSGGEFNRSASVFALVVVYADLRRPSVLADDLRADVQGAQVVAGVSIHILRVCVVRPEFNTTHNAVPVGLGVPGCEVTAAGGVVGVIHPDNQLVITGGCPGEGAAVRRAEGGAVLQGLTVQVDPGLARALKEEGDIALRHFRGDLDGPAEPRESLKLVQIGQAAIFDLGVEPA